jgi:diadenosine tetraphosphate (Ap4A) HIT family hydrolase
MTFQLDPRLQNDCYQLAESEHSLWLLLNNSHFPWFIVVPKTQCTELYQLDKAQQQQIQGEIDLISEFASTHFECDKLNVACIGNIVKQMHIHVIARTESDPCWPGVVWGTSFQQPYKGSDALQVQEKLALFCQEKGIKGLQFAPFQ